MTGFISWKSNCLYVLMLLTLQLVCLTGCSRPPTDFTLSYDFDEYDKKYSLDENLKEISGMAYLGDKKIALVQDEKGIIYIYSLKSGEVADKIKFVDKGDFEGLAKCGEVMYPMTSDGLIYTVDPANTNHREFRKVELSLAKEDELEGFCYYPQKKKFLLVYKEASSLLESDARSIYIYKAGRTSHAKLPFFTITNQKVERYTQKHEDRDSKLSELVASKKTGDVLFQPSGIAIHPLTGNAFVISGVNELLMIIDLDAHEIVHMHKFSKKDLSQPEGIAFDNDGDLYISSEKGSAKKARILRFEMNED